MMKRHSIFAWALLTSMFTASMLYAQTRPLKKVQVGVPAISMGNIVIYFTKEAKIFEKYGLDVEPVAVAGSGIASKALISGSVQISPIATPTVMSCGARRLRHGDLGAHHAGRDSILDGALGHQAHRRSSKARPSA